ncbi:MAG: hypothetical protein ACYDBZ_12410 [Steroidobacteraceae bacterium]
MSLPAADFEVEVMLAVPRCGRRLSTLTRLVRNRLSRRRRRAGDESAAKDRDAEQWLLEEFHARVAYQ